MFIFVISAADRGVRTLIHNQKSFLLEIKRHRNICDSLGTKKLNYKIIPSIKQLSVSKYKVES